MRLLVVLLSLFSALVLLVWYPSLLRLDCCALKQVSTARRCEQSSTSHLRVPSAQQLHTLQIRLVVDELWIRAGHSRGDLSLAVLCCSLLQTLKIWYLLHVANKHAATHLAHTGTWRGTNCAPLFSQRHDFTQR